MDSKEFRKKYINYFKKHNHIEIDGASLIPDNDSSVLFTTAGMHPLVPYLMGKKHPKGTRLVNYQRCLRTGDIDEVGDDTHLTFFEMLGNWSLNDYFKKESIKLSYNFLIEELNLDQNKLGITVFKGDEDAPRDEESAAAWKDLGIKEDYIAYLGKKDNWWGPVGETGPCGPDTEIFYWRLDTEVPTTFDPKNDGWVEIWNNVFMEYNKTDKGFIPSEYKNVDTGMGFERMVTILQGKDNVYETDLFESAMEYLNNKISDNKKRRIITDHLRAAIFLITDGVLPSNTDQGYILRRLIRIAIKNMASKDFFDEDLEKLCIKIIEPLNEAYPILKDKQHKIISEIHEERAKFRKILVKGEKLFEKIVSDEEIINKIVAGKTVFKLYDTYGLPMEITRDIADKKDMAIDIEGYNKLFKEHQEKSRVGADKKFKGGLADTNESTTKLHTATHLLQKALQIVLGDHVHQKGSNINEDRLRFDFSHDEKVTPEQLKEVEDIVNEQVNKGLDVTSEEMNKEAAIESGAECLFIEKYGDVVTIYSIGDFSKEICGGPHVSNTKELGTFKIKKEQASAAGIRRIKAVLINK